MRREKDEQHQEMYGSPKWRWGSWRPWSIEWWLIQKLIREKVLQFKGHCDHVFDGHPFCSLFVHIRVQWCESSAEFDYVSPIHKAYHCPRRGHLPHVDQFRKYSGSLALLWTRSDTGRRPFHSMRYYLLHNWVWDSVPCSSTGWKIPRSRWSRCCQMRRKQIIIII